MVFKSFADLGAALYGLEKKPKKERTYYCRICGKPMRRVGESNVYLCDGVNKENKPCNGRFILQPRRLQFFAS